MTGPRIVRDGQGREWRCRQVGTSGGVASVVPPNQARSSGMDVTVECWRSADKGAVLITVSPDWDSWSDDQLLEQILASLGPE